ncbi:MAG: winged helix-turn-helix transcriptional regulator [Proteobacteria bacterium]|nr:winged helix-turn-helix transcriptional regulator [Pseudomonadota bacterium]MBI3497984.1 winged helix-turn-helix transcriptional regulator [Pseudomonadota bacterium]
MKPIPSPPEAIAAPGLELERFLPYRLSVLTNTVSRAIARLYAERFGLSIPEWRVMAALGRYRRLSASEICGVTAMDKVQVSRAVGRMLDRRLISRIGDAADRRRRVLSLAPRGRAIYAEIVPLALGREANLMAALTPTESALLDRLLAKLQAQAARL